MMCRQVFTIKELFPAGEGVAECHECGALVTSLTKHRDWHNKVADL